MGARFCGACGTALDANAVSASAPLGAREERRVATVLFADLSGFTSLSEHTDHEEVRALVDRCAALTGAIVDRFGGDLDKIIGDAILAVWGAPVAYEDHAERAVRAALEMQECARTHEKDFGGLPLRIGVNTGELMFAPVGPEGRREQTVLGDLDRERGQLRQLVARRLAAADTLRLGEAMPTGAALGEALDHPVDSLDREQRPMTAEMARLAARAPARSLLRALRLYPERVLRGRTRRVTRALAQLLLELLDASLEPLIARLKREDEVDTALPPRLVDRLRLVPLHDTRFGTRSEVPSRLKTIKLFSFAA